MKTFFERVMGIIVWVIILYCIFPAKFERTLDAAGMHSATHYLPHVILSSNHIRWVTWSTFQPDAGYIWKDANAPFYGTAWQAGMSSPEFRHVQASSVEGRWIPADGYVWEDLFKKNQISQADRPLQHAYSKDTEYKNVVVWTTGRSNRDYPHIKSHEKEGYWTADSGYRFKEKDALAVTWYEGARFPGRPHLFSAASEGHWLPEPGYKTQKGFLGAESEYWAEGLVHPDDQNVIASGIEGVWDAKAGYRLVNRPNGKFSAELIVPDRAPAVASTPQQGLTDGQIFLGIAAGIICLSFEKCRNAAGSILKHEAEKEMLRAITK